MSRWISNFASHGFHAQWKRITDAAAEIKSDDPMLVPHIDEIARLKKVISYINSGIAGVDPELLPLGFWDFIRDQMAACADQLIAFNGSKVIGHLQQANQLLDNVLSQVRPHMLAKGKLGPALQSAAKAYSTAMEDATRILNDRMEKVVAEIDSTKVRASDLLAQVGAKVEEVNKKHDELLVDSAGQESTYTALTRHIEEIVTFHRRLAAGTAENPSIREEIAAAREVSKAGKDAIEALSSGAASTIKNLAAFEARIFGAEKENGQRDGGLNEELDRRLEKLKEIEGQQLKRYTTLNEKIESLLPGATSAGLASAYKQMRDSFAMPIRNANRLFYVSIFAIVILSLLVNVEAVGLWWIKFAQLTDWTSIGRSVAHKLPFYAPLVWLAYYASKRRSEFQRLEQEYAHKEALAKSYDSYRQQIVDLGANGDELMRDLLSKAVDAIAFNASKSLDGKHGDKIPLQEGFEKVVAVAIQEARKPNA